MALFKMQTVLKDDTWYVESPYWRMECGSEAAAKRLVEIVEGAYRSGQEDLREDLDKLLRPASRKLF